MIYIIALAIILVSVYLAYKLKKQSSTQVTPIPEPIKLITVVGGILDIHCNKLPNIKVKLKGSAADFIDLYSETDADGLFKFDKLLAGTYTLTIVDDRYVEYTEELILTGNSNTYLHDDIYIGLIDEPLFVETATIYYNVDVIYNPYPRDKVIEGYVQINNEIGRPKVTLPFLDIRNLNKGDKASMTWFGTEHEVEIQLSIRRDGESEPFAKNIISAGGVSSINGIV